MIRSVSCLRYNEKIINYFTKNKFSGKFEENKNIYKSLVGKASCGDVLKLEVKIEDEIIKDAKYKVFGCGSAIASSELLCELLINKNINEINIDNKVISSKLNLPPIKIHCSVLAEEALEKIITDYKNKKN